MDPAPVSAAGPSAALLADCLLVQASTGELEDALRLADRDGSGLVVTGKDALSACSGRWRERFRRPVLADRRRYSGKARSRGTAPLSNGWLDDQRAAGTAVVLTDSGYVGERDERALGSVLDQAAHAAGDVVAVLPLHISWLREGLKTLIFEVNSHGIPVALVLEHREDPLGTRWAVAGLTELLRQSQVPAGLLSADVSGLGAIASGAQWSAVGVKTSLRHLYPVSDGGFHQAPSISGLIRPLLAMVTVQKIAEAWARTCDNPEWVHDIWTCGCQACQGRTLDWLATAAESEVNAHTFELLLDLRDNLAGMPAGRLRQRSWTSKCEAAASRYDELRLGLRVGWKIPGYLKSWTAI
jgi:hypothetical protein